MRIRSAALPLLLVANNNNNAAVAVANIATILSAGNNNARRSVRSFCRRRVTTQAFVSNELASAANDGHRRRILFPRHRISNCYSAIRETSSVGPSSVTFNREKTTYKHRNNIQIRSMATSSGENETDVQLLRRRKQSLRKAVRARIKSSYPAARTAHLAAQSDLVFSRLFELPEYRNAKSVGFFLSMPFGEIQTRRAIRQIVNVDGKELYVPRVGLDFERCDMDLVRCDASSSSRSGGDDGKGDDELFYDVWPRNKWGIPEPPITTSSNGDGNGDDLARPGDIDLLIVPGLAFDALGHRLGQGKGYYDRFIARMRDGDGDGGGTEGKPLLVGVCLEEQFLEEVPDGVDSSDRSGGVIPVSDHDYIMDMVLASSRTVIVPKLS